MTSIVTWQHSVLGPSLVIPRPTLCTVSATDCSPGIKTAET
jgi:hypothetical protein